MENTGNVKIELKKFMLKNRSAGTVKEWNLIREMAKTSKIFSRDDISALDASGFITEWLIRHRQKSESK